MRDWNVVVTVHNGGYNEARRVLERFGLVHETDYFNILLMETADYWQLLDGLQEMTDREPGSIISLARVMPVVLTFSFQTPAEFNEKARSAVSSFIPDLAGKSFHVRMHRRGFRGKISGMEEEQMLDGYLLQELTRSGGSGRITFDDPDAIIAVETIGPRAGVSLWTREELKRYPLLHLD